MRVLVAGASGALGVPLTRALLTAGHGVIGLSRTPANRERLRALGAEPLIADVMDRVALLAALDELRADAVVHALSALKKAPVRHRDMVATDALRVSNAKVKRELGWAPSVPTYREGIERVAASLRVAAPVAA
jgi:uncharacterized protein YbjT (DUF2867 family)